MADDTLPQAADRSNHHQDEKAGASNTNAASRGREHSLDYIAKRRKQAIAWRAANPELYAEQKRRRSARRSAERKAKRDAKPKETPEERAERIRAYKRAWGIKQRAERPDIRKASKKAWAAQWREKNRALANAQVKAWYDANPEKKRLIKRVAAARRRNAPGKFTSQDVRDLLKLQKHKCAYAFCRASLKAGFDVDHIVPIALGGSNDRRNIQLLCEPCNTRKSAKHPVTFAQENGLLL